MTTGKNAEKPQFYYTLELNKLGHIWEATVLTSNFPDNLETSMTVGSERTLTAAFNRAYARKDHGWIFHLNKNEHVCRVSEQHLAVLELARAAYVLENMGYKPSHTKIPEHMMIDLGIAPQNPRDQVAVRPRTLVAKLA